MAIKKAVQKAKDSFTHSNEAQDLMCLGYFGMQLVIYSPALQQVVYARPEQLTQKFLLSVCGWWWLERNFGPDVQGMVPNDYGFDDQMCIKHLVAECQEAGHFSPGLVRPEGVYREGDAVIVNTGEEVFRSDGKPVISLVANGGRAYTQVGQGLGLSPKVAPASRKDVCELEKFISSWHFRSSSDPVFLMGWFAMAVYAGALERRPHVCVTGRRGLGKTMLRDVVGGLFGPAALLVDGSSTVAGISQALSGRPIPVFVDEAEMHASGNSLRQVVRAARSSYSSSGDGRVVGSGSGKARMAPLVSPFFFSCVQPPHFEASDASRWVLVEVTGLKPEAAENPSPFVLDEEYRAEVGARLRMMLVRRWPAFSASLPVFRSLLLKKVGDARLAETLAPLCAGYWTLKYESPAKPADAVALVKKLHGTVQASTEQPADEFECLNSLLTKLVVARSMRGEGKVSIAEMLQRACGGDTLADIQLQRLGIRAYRKNGGEWTMSVPVSTSHQGLHSLFVGTRWAKGNWGAVLKRLPGAQNSTQRVLGVATKVIEFPIPVELVKPVASETLRMAA
ncbi:MAG: hypothetical protein KIT42_05190 [Rhodocyclaceae bacterium]|nr:hypothetical protein [Rhodocyclaceae bacterium]